MPTLTRRTTLAALLATPFALIAGRSQAATHSISIEGFAFSPAELTAAVGDTITVTNNDGAPHTLTADDGSFDTGRLNRGQSGEITLTAAGSFPFKCAFHPSMTGTITVA
ncbi:cupredoxin domain-containing protein [Nioella sp.]|uniref:cupredoxin domain-containing protein n=1 Tax=Nioella sp. TaxID=1912091 RepID=UPI003B528853